jgi:two-component system LytT family response regulator
MEHVRALIADDEPLARDRLRAMLRAEATVELVAECKSGPEAIANIREQTPDVAFLDLQMPGCDGLAVVAEIAPAQRPAVVFVTAHDRYAVDAFKVGAVDYLLKPFDRERLQTALRRATEHLRARHAGTLEKRIEKILANAPPPTPLARRSERFAVKLKGRIVFVAPEDIGRIEAADNYVILHLHNRERVMVRESLSAMEERLGADRFARVNRSTLVPVAQIKELKGTTYGDYTVILRDGSRVPLSRGLRGQFEKFAADGL